MRGVRRGRIYVGPSGWSYPGWSAHVMRGVPLKQRLAHVGRLFDAVEVNGSHYTQIAARDLSGLGRPDAARLPVRREGSPLRNALQALSDCGDSIRRLRDQARGLGDKLAAVVWQLPARFRRDLERLEDFLRALRSWNDTRHAIELRDASWFDDEVRARLARARVANCLSDAPDFPMWDAVTTDLVYVRLHGHTRKYASSYSGASLARWAARAHAWAREGRDVHIYLDNDAEGAAVRNALALRALPRDAPLRRATRSPRRRR
jgi:uncharacterized protein YecE (DUF72 family)